MTAVLHKTAYVLHGGVLLTPTPYLACPGVQLPMFEHNAVRCTSAAEEAAGCKKTRIPRRCCMVCAKPRLIYVRHVNDRAIPFSCTTCIRALRRPPRTNFLMMSPPRPSPRHTHAEQCCPASFSWRGLRRRRSTTRRSSGARRSSTETLVTSASKTPTYCS